jgi:sulfur carrier protein ThiS
MIRVADETLPWYEGMTVADLLRDMGETHPYPVVRINNRYISRPNFTSTAIPDEAVVYLIPMIAGG